MGQEAACAESSLLASSVLPQLAPSQQSFSLDRRERGRENSILKSGVVIVGMRKDFPERYSEGPGLIESSGCCTWVSDTMTIPVWVLGSSADSLGEAKLYNETYPERQGYLPETLEICPYFCLEMDCFSLNNSDSALTFFFLLYYLYAVLEWNPGPCTGQTSTVSLSYIPSPWFPEPRFPSVVQAALGFVILLLQLLMR